MKKRGPGWVLLAWLGLSWVMALAPSAAADGIFLVPGSRQADPGGLRLEALTQPEQVRPGGMFRVVIVAILEPGWHIYSI
ncbi:MAG: hypothetical protein ACE5ER_02135, partial [Nitrospinaceae bacterium]